MQATITVYNRSFTVKEKGKRKQVFYVSDEVLEKLTTALREHDQTTVSRIVFEAKAIPRDEFGYALDGGISRN